MLMRYWAKATLSAFPLIVMVLSRFAGASLSSQFEILIIAPLICLEGKQANWIFSPTVPLKKVKFPLNITDYVRDAFKKM